MSEGFCKLMPAARPVSTTGSWCGLCGAAAEMYYKPHHFFMLSLSRAAAEMYYIANNEMLCDEMYYEPHHFFIF